MFDQTTTPRRRRKTGLTLIEVIVTLTIVLILITMLLPAINSSRESARRTKCAHNIRQIGVNNSAGNGTVLYTICPSDPEAEIRKQRSGTSFVQNTAIRRKKNQMAYSKTIIFFEAAVGMDRSTVDPSPWFESTNTPEQSWQQLQTVIATKRHTGEVSNYVYADGHVIAIPESQIRTWIDDRVRFLLVNQATYSPVTVHGVSQLARNSKGTGTNFRRRLEWLTELLPAEKLSQSPYPVNACYSP